MRVTGAGVCKVLGPAQIIKENKHRRTLWQGEQQLRGKFEAFGWELPAALNVKEQVLRTAWRASVRTAWRASTGQLVSRTEEITQGPIFSP